MKAAPQERTAIAIFFTVLKPELRVSMSNISLNDSRQWKNRTSEGNLAAFLSRSEHYGQKGIAACFPWNKILSPSSCFHDTT